jgi:hypothetical protein
LRGVEASVPETRLTHVVDQHYELARTLISSRASLAALDLEQESPKLRERYGRHRVGQCCLMARRLVEAGIPFVQVNWSTHVEGPEDAGDGGWDMHDRYFQIMQDRHGWMLDQALSALLDDLRDRRLLESTIVVAMGEFGRTPKINDKADAWWEPPTNGRNTRLIHQSLQQMWARRFWIGWVSRRRNSPAWAWCRKAGPSANSSKPILQAPEGATEIQSRWGKCAVDPVTPDLELTARRSCLLNSG